jgi:hypothetical protein
MGERTKEGYGQFMLLLMRERGFLFPRCRVNNDGLDDKGDFLSHLSVEKA